jgi:hypothetical protein
MRKRIGCHPEFRWNSFSGAVNSSNSIPDCAGTERYTVYQQGDVVIHLRGSKEMKSNSTGTPQTKGETTQKKPIKRGSSGKEERNERETSRGQKKVRVLGC